MPDYTKESKNNILQAIDCLNRMSNGIVQAQAAYQELKSFHWMYAMMLANSSSSGVMQYINLYGSTPGNTSEVKSVISEIVASLERELSKH